MPRHRPPLLIWREIRRLVYERDRGCCQGPYCRRRGPYPPEQVVVDHVRSGKLAGNTLKNLRLLCRRCHALRLDPRHRGLIAAALREGLIPPDWRAFAWSEEYWPSEETSAKLAAWVAAQETQGNCLTHRSSAKI